MEILGMNLRLLQELTDWDPFGYGKDSYDTEIADSIQAVHLLDDADKLAEQLQSIYEYSFEKWIPLDQCLVMARKLLAIKHEGSCSI